MITAQLQKNNYKIPRLRFSEFDAQWDHKRLSELLSESKKRNSDLKYGKEQVLSVSGKLGIINQIEHLGRSYAGESVHNYHVVENGDIVYTKSPLKDNPYGIIKFNKGKPGIVSTLYAVYKVNDKTAFGLFLDYYFSLDANTNRYLRPLVKKGAKNDMKINNEYVLHDKIFIPSVDEQKKIVFFLDAVSAFIGNLQKQKDFLTDYKKEIARKIFNQEINFKDDNKKQFPVWKNYNLGQILEEYVDKNNTALNEVVAVGKYGIRKRSDIYSKELSKDISKNKIIYKDTLTIGIGSTQIDIGILLENKIYSVSPAYATFKIINADSYFLKELLSNLNKKLSILYMITGARQGKSINKKGFLNHKIKLPDIKEQQKIADFLAALDRVLEAKQQQITLAENWKKGLMQRLFI